MSYPISGIESNATASSVVPAMAAGIFKPERTPMKDALREAREAILAVIAELKLAGVPVPIGLHRAAQALHHILQDDEPRRAIISDGGERSTLH
jgi:hypothetical protein